MKHKHCEVIKAWADGKEIQYFSPAYGIWKDAKMSTPSFSKDDEYRVKPETIRYRVALFRGYEGGYFTDNAVGNGMDEKDMQDCTHFVRWLTDWIEVEV